MEREQAEIVALKALAWIAGDRELLSVFLGSTGSCAEDLRGQAGDPAFMVSVLDFLVREDTWIVAFCNAEDLPYETPMLARRALPGGSDIHWT